MDLIKDIIEKSQTKRLLFYNNGDQITAFEPTIYDNITKEIEGIVKKNIIKIDSTLIVPYNPIGSDDNTIEYCKVNKYKEVEMMYNKIIKSKPGVGKLTPDIIDFYIYEFSEDNRTVRFIKRNRKMNILRKGFFGQVIGKEFKQIDESSLFMLDDKIDMIIFENEIFILNHISFERIFRLYNEFQERATKVLDDERLKKRIVHYNDLKEEILNNKNFVKRVSKLSYDSEGSMLFLNKDSIEKARTVIEKFSLDIKINSKDQYVYDNKLQASEFIKLMQDAYYKTLIGENLGTDDRR